MTYPSRLAYRRYSTLERFAEALPLHERPAFWQAVTAACGRSARHWAIVSALSLLLTFTGLLLGAK